jgi:hypothetical protein
MAASRYSTTPLGCPFTVNALEKRCKGLLIVLGSRVTG